ncbi:MAG: hypothetical protein IPK37_01785 [Austwickia sp.]|nr:MAG: hypothetical protein IPK37_01785 [Austwickia sp.]
MADAPKPLGSSGSRDTGRVTPGLRPPRSTYGAMLRTAAGWTAAAGVLAAVAYGLTRGLEALLSCAAGVAFVAAMFASGMWGLRLVLRGAAHLAQAGAFAVFFLQMYVGTLLAVAGRSAAWLDTSALAAGAIGATLVWQAGMVTGFATARRQVYSREDGAPDPGAQPSNTAGEGGRP